VKQLSCILLVFCLVFSGCSRVERVLGTIGSHPSLTVAAAQQMLPGKEVTLRGKLVEKCPVAGCWFVIRDETGTIKVDTKTAGFVVLDVPLQKQILIDGIVSGDGAARVIDAKGVRY
jgi:uncharacterized protein YdeI (BOF family)